MRFILLFALGCIVVASNDVDYDGLISQIDQCIEAGAARPRWAHLHHTVTKWSAEAEIKVLCGYLAEYTKSLAEAYKIEDYDASRFYADGDMDMCILYTRQLESIKRQLLDWKSQTATRYKAQKDL